MNSSEPLPSSSRRSLAKAGRRVLLALLALSTTQSLRGQGLVNFANSISTKVSTNGVAAGGTTGVTAPVPGMFMYGLFVAPSTVTTIDPSLQELLSSIWTFTGLYATNTAIGGRLIGGVGVPAYGWLPGVTNSFLVVGWSTSLGTSWGQIASQLNGATFVNGGWSGSSLGYSMGVYWLGASDVSFGAAGGVYLGTNTLPAFSIFGGVPNGMGVPLSHGFTLYTGLGDSGPYFCCCWLYPLSQTVNAGASATFTAYAEACPPPATYQWFFNGAPIAGAVDSVYQIPNTQPTNAGQYFAVLSGAWPDCCGGSVHTSAVATLTVLTKPIIASQPQTQTAEAGSTVQLRAMATGSAPLGYQWVFNNAVAAAGTGSRGALILPSVESAQAGAYTVVFSNSVGAVTSPPAMLSVISPLPHPLVPALLIRGYSAGRVNLQYAAACVPPDSWSPLDSLDLTNSSQWYFDLTAPAPAQCFYRAWHSSPTAPAPSLNLFFAPAITVTGAIGSSLRLDCINQIGPTDAWWTLDTITLTNTSQLYFDTSSIGQPARVWRIVSVP